MWILPDTDRRAPRAGDPALALPADRRFDALALRVRFLVGAEHHQQAVNEIHWLRLEALAVVLAAVAGGYHRDAGVDDLRELRLGLQRLGAA
ncbi:hypothetical protein WL60_18720 [Burkholderia ubonensis]|nr:hypothetical protein WL59_07830 [Burkholderia ubonensis]KWD12629.1 hypothetical protein WL60_18720 [Burkholderia ubonensis]